MRPPDNKAGRPRQGRPATSAPATALDALTVPRELAAWRCWTHRARHACGCGRAADCLLNDPLPVHAPQPCAGQFGEDGRWRAHCRAAS